MERRTPGDETNPYVAPRTILKSAAAPKGRKSALSLVEFLGISAILGVLVGLLVPAVHTSCPMRPARPVPQKVIPSESSGDDETTGTSPDAKPSS